MKYLFNYINRGKSVLKSPAYLVMLDFDGTLSAIAPSPSQARINKLAKRALKNLSTQKNVHVAIISGRSLADIKNKARIKGLTYAGNHGQEWEIGGKRFTAKIPKAYKKIAPLIKNKLLRLLKQYKNVFLEYKGAGIAIHYRRLKTKSHIKFQSQVALILKPYIKAKALTIIMGKKVIDIRPLTKWNKGSFSLYLVNLLKKAKVKLLVIYFGDDTTDEDAFKALKKEITVRVGKKHSSEAKYYVKNPKEITAVLTRIANNL